MREGRSWITDEEITKASMPKNVKKITEAERKLRVLEEVKWPGVLGLTGNGAVDMAIRKGVI